jgi:hypothetical protein
LKVGVKMYCRYCGNQLETQDIFCSKCGKSISIENASESETPNILLKEQVESVVANELELANSLVGKNYDYYKEKWNKLESKKSKTSWNWAAFFLGPLWFGYRKMYIPMVLIAVCYILLDLFFYLFQYQFSEENYFFDPVQNLLLFPITVILAMFGNYYYLKHTNRNIDKVNLQPFNFEQKRTWLKRKGGTSWLGVVFTILLLFTTGVLSALLLPTNVDQILTVKDGSFYEYPTTTIGDAFNDFFGDPNWEYVSADSPFDIVRFTGVAEEDGEMINVLIDFIITEDSFEIHSAMINGEYISDDDLYSMLDVIFIPNESESDIVN